MRTALGDQQFTLAFEEGRTLEADAAVQRALARVRNRA
jgi:hypothetical protein